MNAVFFEANHDGVTKKVHLARRKALPYTLALPQYDLFGSDAYASDVKLMHTKATQFGLFSGMAHGDVDVFEGQGGGTVFDTTNSAGTDHTIRGAIIHLYSCNCGQELGPHLVSHAAKAFIGYKDFVRVPEDQSVADEFVKVAAAINRSVISGNSSAVTKRMADQEFASVEARIAASATATAHDLASFRLNHRAMVGPWTDPKYGSF